MVAVLAGCGPAQLDHKEAARLITLIELQRVHWLAWEADPEAQPLVREVARDLMVDDLVAYQWAAKIRTLEGKEFWRSQKDVKKGPPEDLHEFGRKAITAFEAGEKEVTETAADGTFQYARMIEWTSGCLRCHRSFQDDPLVVKSNPKSVILIDLVRKPGT